ncbi:uncharacterized protein G2W53_035181 [Senna tora]|uniref:Uncharacterized protein n=1 Tax=Senna tora TaxID=362788 RepID=A0A834SSD9_9FABA|nr:uncharacterized protein G2W53_035181 [Senna tora]
MAAEIALLSKTLNSLVARNSQALHLFMVAANCGYYNSPMHKPFLHDSSNSRSLLGPNIRNNSRKSNKRYLVDFQGQLTAFNATLETKHGNLNAYIAKLANRVYEMQAKLNSMPSNTTVNPKALNVI